MRKIIFNLLLWLLVIGCIVGAILELFFAKRKSICFLIGDISAVIILLRTKKNAERDEE